jgi:hypothetical protein
VIATRDLALSTTDYVVLIGLVVFCGVGWLLWHRDDKRRDAMAKERWEALQSPTGWTVERNGRLVSYDVPTVNAVRKLVTRKGGDLSTLRFTDRHGNDVSPGDVEEDA